MTNLASCRVRPLYGGDCIRTPEPEGRTGCWLVRDEELQEITILGPWRSSPKTAAPPSRLELHALDSSANTRTTSQDPDPGPFDLHFSELHAFVRGVVGPVEDQVVVSAGSSEDHAMATVAGPQGLVVLNPGPRDGSIF